MQRILLLFKAVAAKQLSDPGPQLQMVLNFKKKIEEEKQHLYRTFDSRDSFKRILQQELAGLVRQHEGDTTNSGTAAQVAAVELEQRATALAYLAVSDLFEERPPSSLAGQAAHLWEAGRLTEAESLFAEAVASASDPADALYYSAYLYGDRRYDQAEDVASVALKVAEELGDTWVYPRALTSLGSIARSTDRLLEAEALYRKALGKYEEHEDIRGVIRTRRRLGEILVSLGDYVRAGPQLSKSLELANQLGEPVEIAISSSSLAALEHRLGRHRNALGLLERAEQLQEEAKNLRGVAANLSQIGVVLAEMKEYATAEQIMQRALTIFKHDEDQLGVASTSLSMGNLFLSRELPEEARKWFADSLAIYDEFAVEPAVASCWIGLGSVEYSVGNYDAAEFYYMKALGIHQRGGRLASVAVCLHNLGLVAGERREHRACREFLQAARDIYQRMGLDEEATRLNDALQRSQEEQV
jgi:tetratricopeptide (TPR) repeat protein